MVNLFKNIMKAIILAIIVFVLFQVAVALIFGFVLLLIIIGVLGWLYVKLRLKKTNNRNHDILEMEFEELD